MSKKQRYFLITDVLTVIAEFVDKFSYPNCCLVNKEWYQVFKRFNKSFSYYYLFLHNPPGGAPRTHYFVCNTLEEIKIAIEEEIYNCFGFWYFSFQDHFDLVKVERDEKTKKTIDLYDYITIKYPEKFGDLTISYKSREQRDDKNEWSEEQKEKLEYFMEECFEMDFEKDSFRNKINVFIDMKGIINEFGGNYVGSLTNTYDIRKEKKLEYICCDEVEESKVITVDDEQLEYGKMVQTDL